MMKKIVFLLLLGLLAFSFAACSSSNANAVIEFNDEVLEEMVRSAMGKPDGDILISDALEVTELNFQMDGNDWSIPRIHNLEALKYFTNLTSLNLNWAVQNEEEGSFADVDISALSALTKLESLQLACVNVQDISALSSMTNLKGLSMFGTRRIDDISALANLTSLEAVDLRWNFIKDLTPLSGLSNLNFIDVSGNIISDVAPLAGLTNLSELYISDNLIRDYAPLAAIASNLENRDFEPIAQPQPIDFKDAVLEKRIRATLNLPTGDITILDTEAITELSLGNDWSDKIPDEDKISDISALKYFPNLYTLDLRFNNIEWIEAVRAMPNLGILDLNGNRVSDIAPISKCSHLKTLNLNDCKSTGEQLVALSSLAELEWLDLSYSPAIGSVEALSGLTSLKSLHLKGIRVDYTGIANLTNLTTLYLEEPTSDGYVPDYSALKDIYPNLTDKNFEIPEN
ncbi:MAG: leucine-rich repeat domain-containing protein [Clostridia bacterium]|nr:leucine-rich repeat domain-containing protein [Clostridia bacterium]